MYADHAIHHDAHHSENTGNYGMPFWDDIFGTTIPFDHHALKGNTNENVKQKTK